MAKIRMINFNDIYDPTKVITNHNPLTKGEFSPDGVFSEEIYGSDSLLENIDSIAWIDFGENHYVISPLIYPRLARLMKASYLDAIIQYNKRIDADGNFNDELEDESGIKKVKIPDVDIGLYEFKKNFLTYLNRYTPEDKKESPEYRNVVRWYLEDKIFINKLPVFSPKLRPAQIHKADKTFQFSEINNYYNFIIAHTNNLKTIVGNDEYDDIKLQKQKILYKIQQYINKVGDYIIDMIKGKRGIIRKILLASRINFSARNVIIPNPSLRANEVVLNYVTFLELYKIPLINLISLLEDIDFLAAKKIVKEAQLKFDPKVYRYMKELLTKTKNGIRMIINRNPSISIHSIAVVKVVDIVPDYHNYTLHLSNNVLAGLNADFDGNIIKKCC